MSACASRSTTRPVRPVPGEASRARPRLAGAEGERRRSGRRSSVVPESGMGILIIEDDDDSRDILSTFFAANGYPVMTARHGRDALDRLRHFAAPCLIFLDLRMPVMDGWAFRRALLADPILASIPVVVLSAVHDVQAAIAGLNVTSYLEKPYDFEALLDIVKRYC